MSQISTQTYSQDRVILSQYKSAHIILMLIGLLLILIAIPPMLAIPKELAQGNNGILAALLFPLFGLMIISMGFKHKKK